MSYISAIRQGDNVLVWERTADGRQLITFPAPFQFYTPDPNGSYTSIYNDTLQLHQFDTSEEMNNTKREFESRRIKTFESDIPPELKVLSQHYYKKEAPKLNVTFLDIEVDYDPDIGFSTIENPYAPINAIAFYHTHTNTMSVLAIPPDGQAAPDKRAFIKQLNDISPLQTDVNVDVTFCMTERELLMLLLAEIDDSDVLCGWNSDFFDIPYIAERLKLISEKYFRSMDFQGCPKPRVREVELYGKINRVYDLHGRVSTDYLQLFKTYEMSRRHSYKLEYIADEVLPDLPKLEYKGSLARLYRDDFAYFVRYNIRDTEILKGLEDKLGYVDVANQMCHMSTGLFKHVNGTLKLAELATINFCHHELGGLVVNDVHVPEEDGRIDGAFVLLPQIGEHHNTGSVDITSLYPTAIWSVNISPETLLGQFAANEHAAKQIRHGTDELLLMEYDDGREETLTAVEWQHTLRARKHSISGYGTLFSQEKQGIIPAILTNWFNTRKDYQRLKGEAKAAGDKAQAAYCDKLQYIYKIKLNSFYGALTNKFFRFYDLRMGESTTATGRAILMHQCAKVCEILDGEYAMPDRKETDPKTGKLHLGYSDKWSVIYGDTDSTYFATHCDDSESAILVADRVGELINKSFPEFMKESFILQDEFANLITTGREIVAARGIFVDKKRYILHIINDDGDTVDKLKVMGLDTKKTTLPKAVSTKLNKFIERYLKGEEWDVIAREVVDYKSELTNSNDIRDLGLPKAVKNVEAYTREHQRNSKCRLPGHVAASIFYNINLDKYGDTQSVAIASGNNIKVFYLRTPVGRFKSIALPVDMDEEPVWFKDFVVDKGAAITRLVDNPLQNIIKAINKRVPTEHSLFADSIIEF